MSWHKRGSLAVGGGDMLSMTGMEFISRAMFSGQLAH